jgi:hypothetical protein
MNSKTYWLAMSMGILSMAGDYNSYDFSRATSGHRKSFTDIQRRSAQIVKKRNRRRNKAARQSRKANR